MKVYVGIIDWDTLRNALESIEEGLDKLTKNVVKSAKKPKKNTKNLIKKRK